MFWFHFNFFQCQILKDIDYSCVVFLDNNTEIVSLIGTFISNAHRTHLMWLCLKEIRELIHSHTTKCWRSQRKGKMKKQMYSLNIRTSLTLNSGFCKLGKKQVYRCGRWTKWSTLNISLARWFSGSQSYRLEYVRRSLTNTYAENPSPAPPSSDLIGPGPV